MIVRLIVRRLLFLVLVMFGLSVITFSISRIIPADPARLMLGPRASRQQVDKQREKLGLNDPYPKQYVDYVWDALHGDFGLSTSTRRPVATDLRKYLPGTIEMGMYAFLLATVIGVPLGVASAVRRDTLIDHVSRFVSITGLALPVFWLALMVQFLFYGQLHILPDGQRLPQGVDPPRAITSLYTVDALLEGNFHLWWLAVQHLIMPVAVLAYGSVAVVTRMVRGGMLEVLNQDYIRTARAKGLAHRSVVNGHALKNALLPTVTQLGLQIGLLLSGTFLVEIIFSWPGIGRYSVDAIQKVDYNAIMATTLIVAVIFVLMNLVVDILYLFLDPRISY
ncbi:MAG TPA: ABC transporter permease [Thermomicrobiales bacterium]|nr:ABC transporter permease [Thermomicrobiales bacterium]HRA48520.1 ABC transporter permease [Thermomicrobiales bacterium]